MKACMTSNILKLVSNEADEGCFKGKWSFRLLVLPMGFLVLASCLALAAVVSNALMEAWWPLTFCTSRFEVQSSSGWLFKFAWGGLSLCDWLCLWQCLKQGSWGNIGPSQLAWNDWIEHKCIVLSQRSILIFRFCVLSVSSREIVWFGWRLKKIWCLWLILGFGAFREQILNVLWRQFFLVAPFKAGCFMGWDVDFNHSKEFDRSGNAPVSPWVPCWRGVVNKVQLDAVPV